MQISILLYYSCYSSLFQHLPIVSQQIQILTYFLEVLFDQRHPQIINPYNNKSSDLSGFLTCSYIPESQTVAISPVVSLAETAVTGLLCPARLWT